MFVNKALVLAVLVLFGVNYVVSANDCETDNGKRIDGCVINK